MGWRLTKHHVLSSAQKMLNHCLEYALGVAPGVVIGGAEPPVVFSLEPLLLIKSGGSAVWGLGPCFSLCTVALLRTESASQAPSPPQRKRKNSSQRAAQLNVTASNMPTGNRGQIPGDQTLLPHHTQTRGLGRK